MSSQTSAIVINTSVAGYFKEQLDSLCRLRKVDLSELAAFYLVNLLSEFSSAEKLFLPAEDGASRELIPLAELKARAVDSTPEERAKLLKHLGDSSLYVGGFFQESLEKHNVDVQYYVDMGGGAYQELSSAGVPREQATLRPVYGELGEKFARLVDLLKEMADLNVGLGQSASRMLNAYERWLKSGSAALGKQLRRSGFMPPSAVKQ